MGSNSSKLKQGLQSAKKDFSIALFFSFFINILMLVSPLFMLQAYDRVLPSRSELTLVMLLLIAISLLIIMAVLDIVRTKLLAKSASKIDSQLSPSVFHAALRLTNSKPTTDASIYLQDVNGIKQFLSGGPICAFFDSPWVPIFILFNFVIHPLLGTISLLGAVFIFLIAFINEKQTRAPTEKSQHTLSYAKKIASQGFTQQETVLSMGMKNTLEKQWASIYQKGSLLQSKTSIQSGSYMAASKAFRLILQTLILAAGCWLAIDQLITPGAMIAASIIMGRALAPVEQAISGWRQFIKARESYQRIQQLLDAYPDPEKRITHEKPSGKLQLNKVIVVAPSSETIVLKGVSFQLEPGESLAVLGQSGSGKSTLARSIVNIWPTRSGNITLDGIELSHWNPEQLGDYIGFMSQDAQFLSGTVAQNIARFNDCEDIEVISAAKLAGVHDLISSLPEGYDTPLDTSASVLSSGQKQLIGFARAVFRKPSLIVLDEPNSHLDSNGDKILAHLLENLKQEKITTIIISHKHDILKHMDKVLIMKQGQVSTFGPISQVFQAQNITGNK